MKIPDTCPSDYELKWKYGLSASQRILTKFIYKLGKKK